MKNEIRKKIAGMRSGKRSHCFRIMVVLMLICVFAILASCDDVASNSKAKSDSDTDTAQTKVAEDTAAKADSASAAATTIDTATLAEQVIAGDWGNGQDRVDALTNAGYNAGEVQAQVNEMLASDTTGNQTGVIWHDRITEPIYENQPVYQYCYMYTFTAVNGKSVSPQVTSLSDYIYATAGAAGTAANGSAAQNAALGAIRAAGYDAQKLGDCTYTITTPSKQTGTKRVQTGTRIVQQEGWY